MDEAGLDRVGSKRSERADDRDVDVVALGIVAAAVLLFVAVGSLLWPPAIRAITGRGPGPDHLILNAFLLNVAIVVMAWARYRQIWRELHARRSGERHALELAETDPLTGFLNRRSFDALADAMIARAERSGQVVAILMIDLDNFKQVNDYNGHHMGDLLLRETADRIAAVLPSEALVGRIGGDEFAIALPFPSAPPERISHLAELLIAAIAGPSAIGAVCLAVTASIGIVRSDLKGVDTVTTRDARGLLALADTAMYQAKRQGRNGSFWFDASMAEEMRFRHQMEHGIRMGIPRGEFIPFYERQIDLETGEVTGFEMLARWDSPEYGVIPPDVFIPIAEEIGAITALSESVIAQALEDARHWDQRLTLAVNISPMQLRDPWFAQKLLRLLVDANFPAQRLEIEITESCLHQNLPQVRSLVTSLKNQGVRISLDDFGTGYSSLAQLRSLPFDRIKIDRTFITSLTDNSDSAAIVHAIALLGQGLNLPVTAEGIETRAALEHLRQYSGLKGQGYVYGQPQPAETTLQFLISVGLALGRGPVVAQDRAGRSAAA